jgi:hypothetical protein
MQERNQLGLKQIADTYYVFKNQSFEVINRAKNTSGKTVFILKEVQANQKETNPLLIVNVDQLKKLEKLKKKSPSLKRPDLSVLTIIDCLKSSIEKAFDLLEGDLSSSHTLNSGLRKFVRPRQMFFYLIQELTHCSHQLAYEKIYLGSNKQGHSQSMHGQKTTRNFLETNDSLTWTYYVKVATILKDEFQIEGLYNSIPIDKIDKYSSKLFENLIDI